MMVYYNYNERGEGRGERERRKEGLIERGRMYRRGRRGGEVECLLQ